MIKRIITKEDLEKQVKKDFEKSIKKEMDMLPVLYNTKKFRLEIIKVWFKLIKNYMLG